MTDILLFAIVVLLFAIWRDLPARQFAEQTTLRIVRALEAIAQQNTEARP